MKKLGDIRTVAVLLAPVPVTALVLALVVVQTRTTALQAPGPTVLRAYGDGVYTVRLGDSMGTAPSSFTALLTGRQAAQLVATQGVVSVTRLPGRGAVAPTLPRCDSATSPAAPAPVPSPSPLPAPFPPADGGVMSPGGDHAAQLPSRPSRHGRPGAAVGNGQGSAAQAASSLPGEVSRYHGPKG